MTAIAPSWYIVRLPSMVTRVPPEMIRSAGRLVCASIEMGRHSTTSNRLRQKVIRDAPNRRSNKVYQSPPALTIRRHVSQDGARHESKTPRSRFAGDLCSCLVAGFAREAGVRFLDLACPIPAV